MNNAISYELHVENMVLHTSGRTYYDSELLWYDQQASDSCYTYVNYFYSFVQHFSFNPGLFLFWILFEQLQNHEIKPHVKKMILILVGILLIWATFVIIDLQVFSENNRQKLIWPASYSMSILFITFFLKMPKPTTTYP